MKHGGDARHRGPLVPCRYDQDDRASVVRRFFDGCANIPDRTFLNLARVPRGLGGRFLKDNPMGHSELRTSGENEHVRNSM